MLKASFTASSDYQARAMFSESSGMSGTTAYVGTSAVCTSYVAGWNQFQFQFQPNFTGSACALPGFFFVAALAGVRARVPMLLLSLSCQ